MRDPIILSQDNLARADLPRAFAEALVGVTAQDRTPLDGFLILFRSTSSPTAARIARERIAEIHHATATAAISDGHASERAALFLAVVAGVQMMRQMLQLTPLTKAEPAVLVDLLTPVIASLICNRGRIPGRCDGWTRGVDEGFRKGGDIGFIRECRRQLILTSTRCLTPS